MGTILKMMNKLYNEMKWEKSPLGRFFRSVLYTLRFSQCRYCIYFIPERGEHKTIRESVIFVKGKCKWSQITGVDISKEEASVFRRCRAFISVLYNIKGYEIADDEVRNHIWMMQNK